MTRQEAIERLDVAQKEFVTAVDSIIEGSNCSPEAKSMAEELCKQMFYTFSDFKGVIIDSID